MFLSAWDLNKYNIVFCAPCENQGDLSTWQWIAFYYLVGGIILYYLQFGKLFCEICMGGSWKGTVILSWGFQIIFQTEQTPTMALSPFGF